LVNAFQIVDDVLRQGVQGISDLITKAGIINVDFADVRSVTQDSGSALMGIGMASGDNRAVQAARQAINSPLLDISIDGAKGVLFNITGGPDLSMMEVNEAAGVITENIDPNARIIFGASIDETMKKGDIKITVVATGFEDGDQTNRSFDKSKVFVGQNKKEESYSKPEPIFVKNPEKKKENNYFSSHDRIREDDYEKKVAEEKKNETEEFSSADDLEIPAFIRRKMNK